jgi:hypothetical protein
MRIKTTQTKNHGSVLLVTLCTAWVIGISLVSYLTLVANQNRTTYHSQSWNACIPVLEAGVEEALTQLNFSGEGLNYAATHNWILTNGVYYKSRNVGTDGSYFEVTIDPNAAGTPATPIIISKGSVPAPGNTGKSMGGESAFGMILATVSGQSTPAMLCRTVKVNTRLQTTGGGPGGISTKGKISFSGGGSLDSFDSSDPAKSGPNGEYVAAKRQANGLAMSNSTVLDAIHVDTAHIYGSVVTGPAGTVTVAGGAVGDIAFNATPTGTHIQTGHQTADANLQFDALTEPFVWSTGFTPLAGGTNVNGDPYTYVLNAAQYTNWKLPGGVNVGGGKSILVTGGDVTLYVNGKFTLGGSGFLYVAPGASLKIYISGDLDVSGTGVVNGTSRAKNVAIYGLGTSNDSWVYSGSSTFIGTVYSPYDQFTFSGSAGASGSFTANNVVISGGAAVHYDESLNGGTLPEYIANSWNEI